eukprot:11709289-Prorocentrum_lima.AAC.1
MRSVTPCSLSRTRHLLGSGGHRLFRQRMASRFGRALPAGGKYRWQTGSKPRLVSTDRTSPDEALEVWLTRH